MRFSALSKSFWLTTAMPPVSSASTRRLSCVSRTYAFQSCVVHLLVDVLPGDQAARVDRVERRVGAIGGARQLGQLANQVGFGQQLLSSAACDRTDRSAGRRRSRRAIRCACSSSRTLERIEVVSAADVDDRLAAVLQLLEVPHQVVGGRERHVRAMAQFGRPLRALHCPSMISFGFSPPPVTREIADRAPAGRR